VTKGMGAGASIARSASYASLLLLLAYPLLCRYDFSRSTLWYYDFLSMNSSLPWVFLLIVGVSAVGLLRETDLRLPSVLAIAFAFSFGEVLTNYPMIWRDVFFHGSGVKVIINEGQVGAIWLSQGSGYPQTHPGFFLLWSIVTLLTGLGTFESNLLLLLPVAVTVMILLLVAIYRRLSIGIEKGAALMAFALMNFNMNEFMFVHFNTRLLSLVYTLLFVVFLLIEEDDRRRVLGMLLAGCALVISHVLNSLVSVGTLAIYSMFKSKRRSSAVLVLLCGALYVGWNIYAGYPMIRAGLPTFLNYYYVLFAMERIYAWSPAAAKPIPFFGLLLETWYKILLITLAPISLYCAVSLRRQRRVRILAAYLLSAGAIYGISFFSVLAWISAHRGIIFASVALASLPIMFFTSAAGKGSRRWRQRVVVAAIVILLIPQFILVHEPPLARCGSVRSIAETSHFVMDHRNGQQIASLNDFPIYYSFYEPSYEGYSLIKVEGSISLKNVSEFLLTRQRGCLKIVDYRHVVDWGTALGRTESYDQALREWNEEVYARLRGRYNMIYATSYETIYV